MFDEEINLDPSGPTSKATQSPSGNATSTAKALLRNQKFYCARIKAEVSPPNCKVKYHYAKAQGITASPCLECAKVLTMMRTVSPDPKLQQPIKEVVHMSKPAKKKTVDPVMSEIREASAPALEVVKPQAPAAKPEAFDPFASWEKYDTLLGRKQRKLAFVRMTPKAIYFSTRCVENLKLAGYATLDVLVAPDLSGLAFRFHKDDAGSFTLSKRVEGKTELKISAAGLVRTYEDLKQHIDKKLEPIVHGPGRVSILFGREVAA